MQSTNDASVELQSGAGKPSAELVFEGRKPCNHIGSVRLQADLARFG